MANASNTSSAFTPGPWHLDEIEDKHLYILNADDKYVADIVFHHRDNRRAEADGDLIVAAPELLHAAKVACEHFHCPDAHAGLRSVIAKAEGRL